MVVFKFIKHYKFKEKEKNMSIAMSIFSLLGTFIIGFSMFPQTVLTLKTKNTASLSLLLYLVMGIATLLLTIYGIGLVIIPNPEHNQAIAEQLGAGSFGFSGNESFDNSSWLSAVHKNWISGYIVPGAALIFGEAICSITSFIIAFIKIKNMLGAKKDGVSELTYIQKKYGIIVPNKKPSAKNKIIRKIRTSTKGRI